MSKIMPEAETRDQLYGWSKKYGCYEDLKKLFDRYDKAMKGCKTNEELKAIQAMGIMELNQFFGKAALIAKYKDGSSIIIDEDNNIKK